VRGDGGKRHAGTLKALVDVGANVNLADRSGATPLTPRTVADTKEMVKILEAASAR
jgi:uncharacterized protein